MSPPSAELVLDQLNRQLAVLEGARAELEDGWVQGGWWSVTSADGNQRLVTGYAAAGGGSPDHVDGSCLVGALGRAGSPSDVGRAVNAVYDALWASATSPALRRDGGLPPVPAPEVRLARVRTLTHWNDRAEPEPGGGPDGGRPGHQRHDHGPDVRAAASSPSRRAAGASTLTDPRQLAEDAMWATPQGQSDRGSGYR